jgi:DNA topoisomerase-6 subunit A
MAWKKRTIVAGRLMKLGEQLVDQITKQENPYMEILERTLSNVKYNKEKQIIEIGNQKQKRYFFNIAMAKKFMQTCLVASTCRTLLDENKTTSIRDLYYMTKHTIGDSSENTFDEQNESDPIIEDVEVLIDVLREELNLFASNRGALVGEITLIDAGDEIDCRRLGTGGWSIPSIVEKDVIQFKNCTAKFVLMVEKDAVWRRLNEDRFWKKYKCILVHGQGMAPRGVRRLLHRFSNELKLPLYVLTDNDPWGLYIYSVIKQGSINLAYESMRLAIPPARFIGLSSFDVENFDIPKNVTIKLTEQDRKRAKEIMDYPWFHRRGWRKEIKKMLENGFKLEIEALSSKGISFISEHYLPKKIKEKDWLD